MRALHGGGGGHHHGGHHHGGGGRGWGGPGNWGYAYPQYPQTELFVVDDRDDAKDKILAYIASLPEKDRAKAFTKFFGAKPTGAYDFSTDGYNFSTDGILDTIKASPLAVPLGVAGLALAAYFLFFKNRPNPSRRRRRRYRRHR